MPLYIVRQDITKMQVDAIVNPTNEKMEATGGVDLAVRTAAGEELDAECKAIAPLGIGEAKLTKGYGLPCRYVIHTVGPTWQGGRSGEMSLLRHCYQNVLRAAFYKGCETVAVPLISSGAYGFPKENTLSFAVSVISQFLYRCDMTVYLCVFDKESYTFSKELYGEIKAFISDEDAEEKGRFVRSLERAAASRMMLRRQERVSASECLPERLCCDADESRHPVSGSAMPPPRASKSLLEDIKNMDKSFAQMLFSLIDRSGMNDVECYKRANVDKRTFSKIKSSKDYNPSKPTAIAFAIALRLDLDETQALLETAGFTLSKSKVFDRIIRFLYIMEFTIFTR